MQLDVIPAGPIDTNAYLLSAPERGEALLIDAPGEVWAEVKPLLAERGCKLVELWITHGHWDHMQGAAEVARVVVELCEKPSRMTFVYEDSDTLWDKINKVAKKVYHAGEVTADSKVRAQIAQLQADGYGHYPICVAKTQYSFSTDASLRGAPENHSVNVREVRLAAGAEFIVMVCGDIMTMPGLPKVPSAVKIDWIDGKVVGLF